MFSEELPDPNDDATVVDPPLKRPPISGPRVSEARLLRQRPEESGVDHRSISTVPPPQSRRSREPAREAPLYRPSPRPLLPETPRAAETPRVAQMASLTEKPRARAASRSDAVSSTWYGSWQLLVAVSLTTVLSIAVGTSLANGELARIIERVSGSSSSGETAHAPPVTDARAPVREVVSPKSAPSAPAVEENTAPVMRFEELPLGKEKGTKKTKRGGRRHGR
jgi:hypothetical protein